MAGAVRPAPAEVPIPRRRSDDRPPVFFHENGTAGWPRLETTLVRSKAPKHYLLTKIGSDASASRSNAAIEKNPHVATGRREIRQRVFHTLQLVNYGHVTFSLDMFASFKLSGHEAKHLRL